MPVDAGAWVLWCCVWDFATAGPARKAATATADSTTFRFVFMINLVRNSSFDVPYIAPILHCTTEFFDHALV
jgi:hypothetical protein